MPFTYALYTIITEKTKTETETKKKKKLPKTKNARTIKTILKSLNENQHENELENIEL